MSYKFKPIKRSEIENKLEKSLKRLLKDDFFLLESDAHERSITHKLAEYLQDEFEEWNVDCEYNRRGHGFVKKLMNWEKDYKNELDNDELKAFIWELKYKYGVFINFDTGLTPSIKEL